jgi:hypothetical protein
MHLKPQLSQTVTACRGGSGADTSPSPLTLSKLALGSVPRARTRANLQLRQVSGSIPAATKYVKRLVRWKTWLAVDLDHRGWVEGNL